MWNRLIHNWKLKLSAFALACFLWALVRLEPTTARIHPGVPVSVVLTDSSFVLADGPDPTTVNVVFRGVPDLLDGLARADISIPVEIADISSTDTLLTLNPEWVVARGLRGVTAESIEPNQVRISVEPSNVRSLPIAVSTRGSLPEEFALRGPLTPIPGVLDVRGPARVLEAFDSIALLPFDLGSVESSGRYPATVDTAAFPGLSIQTVEIDVRVDLDPRVGRTFDEVPIEIRGATEGEFTLEPTTVSVTLTGASSLLDAVDSTALVVFVSSDWAARLRSGSEIRVPLRMSGLPPLVGGTIRPDSVTVRRP